MLSNKSGPEQVLLEELAAMELEETAYVRQGDDLIAQVTLHNRLGKRANVHLPGLRIQTRLRFCHSAQDSYQHHALRQCTRV